MAQLPKPERIDKLQQTFKIVEDDYLRILKIGSKSLNGNGHAGEAEENDERPTKRARNA